MRCYSRWRRRITVREKRFDPPSFAGGRRRSKYAIPRSSIVVPLYREDIDGHKDLLCTEIVSPYQSREYISFEFNQFPPQIKRRSYHTICVSDSRLPKPYSIRFTRNISCLVRYFQACFYLPSMPFASSGFQSIYQPSEIVILRSVSISSFVGLLPPLAESMGQGSTQSQRTGGAPFAKTDRKTYRPT